MYVDMTSQTQQAEENSGISPGNKDITENVAREIPDYSRRN